MIKQGREIKQVNIDENIVRKAKWIMEDFRDFTDGVRLIMLIHRAKEGSKSPNNDKVRKVIVTTRKEYEDTILEMLQEIKRTEIPYRIYASASSRSVEKAMRKFKQEQLDADYFAFEDKHRFYLDIYNRFFGCLSQQGSATETTFLVDLDSKEELEECLCVLGDNDLNDFVIKRYYTKNGSHIVMRPFDPKRLGKFESHVHKDGLILLHY